jgi:CRP/FNR family transcriptional regulator
MALSDPLSALFEPGLLAELERCAVPRHLPAGKAFLEPGQIVRSIPIVLSGLIKVSRLEPDGRELFLYYVNPEETCAMTFTCCMGNQASEIRALAEEDVDLLEVPVKAMDEWLPKYPTWKAFVMRTIRSRFNELLHTIDMIAFQNLDQRLAAFLRNKSKAQGSSLINLSHEAVAAELATSRVVISRLLKKMERDGQVLLYRNQIKLLGEV